MSVEPIKVLIVDDSPITLAVLKRMLMSLNDIEVVGTVLNGQAALEAIPKLNPTVVCTDLHMPIMDGLELTRQIMEKFPRPVLAVSTAVQKEDKDNIFDLLDAGALDVCPKPRGGIGLQTDYKELADELIGKIRTIASIKVSAKNLMPHEEIPRISRSAHLQISSNHLEREIIAIGASTGGPQALKRILTDFPENFPIPIICVLHISTEFLQSLVDWISANCALQVKIAENGQKPEPGTIYFPAADSHLEFDKNKTFASLRKLPYKGYRPSITVTFDSIARTFGENSVGVLLTGMGSDGADGMKAINEQGGLTIGQDEASSVVYGLVKKAEELNVVQELMALDEIRDRLLNL